MTTHVRSRVPELVAEIRQSFNGVPVDIDRVAMSLGVVEIESRTMNVDGYLGVRSDGALAIRYKEGTAEVRRRFTVAHEVAHILIARGQNRAIELPVARQWGRDDDEEKLANYIAATLLVPDELLLTDLRANSVNWPTIHRLSYQYGVSTSTLLRRIREVSGVVAIEIHVHSLNCAPDREPSYRILTSSNQRILFPRHPDGEVKRLVEESYTSHRHSIVICVDGISIRLSCVSRRRSKNDQCPVQFMGWFAEPEEVTRKE